MVNCNDYLPHFREYIRSFGTLQITLVSLSGVFCLITFGVFFSALWNTIKHVSKEYVTCNILLASIYPIVSSSAFFSILVPRSASFCESVSIITFAFTAYHLVLLLRTYIKGDTHFIVNSNENAFTLQRMPCCCFFCFHQTAPTKRKLKCARILVLQMSIVLPIVLFLQNVLYRENEIIYTNTSSYFFPFTFLSIILTIWGLNVYCQLITPSLPPEYKFIQKFHSFRFVLLAINLQPRIVDIIVSLSDFDCYRPLTPEIQANMIMQFIICIEMVLLSIWARLLYHSHPNEIS